MEGKEISDYPENLSIKWKDNKFQTSWNQNICPVQCTINYINDKPIYQVEFGINFSNKVVSNKSPSDAATLLCNNINPESNTRISGVFLFGLHLKSVQQNRKKVKKRSLKSVDNVSCSTLIKKAKIVTKWTLNNFTNISKLYYSPKDQSILEEIQFSIKDYRFKVKIRDENTTVKKQKNKAIVMAIDKGQISQDAYRDLAAIENLNENPDIFNPEVVEDVTTSIGENGQRSIKDILRFIVPSLVERKILDPQRLIFI
ncbi:hypothetical protein GLOIN_2v1789397 [Rhizophagus clarus]|uniref:Uncharacterized protein n=1 Tax=Rhizophagus clarus TaxID=94130 RepID=A0A8H3MKS6_9GLOM|nr:hypothetical protein GLOIN_2v1789397 [Rhizophagus clarus]